jgi:hypothetical protein
MERVERIEDLDVRGFYTQGIVSVGAFILTCTVSCPVAESPWTAAVGWLAVQASFCP